MENKNHILVFHNNGDIPTILEWPTEEKIDTMEPRELKKYAVDLFAELNKRANPFAMFSVMHDFWKVRKDETSLREFMKRFIPIFKSEADFIKLLSDKEIYN